MVLISLVCKHCRRNGYNIELFHIHNICFCMCSLHTLTTVGQYDRPLLAHKDATYRPLLAHRDATYRPLAHKDATYRPLLAHRDATYRPLLAHRDATYRPLATGMLPIDPWMLPIYRPLATGMLPIDPYWHTRMLPAQTPGPQGCYL